MLEPLPYEYGERFVALFANERVKSYDSFSPVTGEKQEGGFFNRPPTFAPKVPYRCCRAESPRSVQKLDVAQF